MSFFNELKTTLCNALRRIWHTLQLFVESKEELRKRQSPSGVSMCVHSGDGERKRLLCTGPVNGGWVRSMGLIVTLG